MSRLNASRIVNLSYNKNTMRINNEVFEFGGESTLMSLRNGGGKTVMVQMLLAPFVRKRNLKDRTFTDYFSTASPTYIMTEWLLDNNSGYVLIGMGIKKKAYTADEENRQELDIVAFVHEYKSGNDYDIHNIPIIDQTDSGIRIKPLGEVKKLFEELSGKRRFAFDYYELNNDIQRKRYYERLKEFRIHQKEWEGIIQKINTKESGLSELFSKSKTITALVNDWFLPAIEDKLNDQGNRIRSFQQILNKFILQLKENEGKLELKKGIEEFREYSDKILITADELEAMQKNVKGIENDIANLYKYLHQQLGLLAEEKVELEASVNDIEKELLRIEYEKLSYDYHQLLAQIQMQKTEIDKADAEIASLSVENARISKEIGRLKCSKLYNDYVNTSKEILELENILESLMKSDEENRIAIHNIGYSLNMSYSSKVAESEKALNEKQCLIDHANKKLEELKQIKEEKNSTEQDIREEIGAIRAKQDSFLRHEDRFRSKYNDFLIYRNIIDEYDEEALELYRAKLQILKKQYSANKHQTEAGKAEAEYAIREKNAELKLIFEKKLNKQNNVNDRKARLQKMEEECSEIRKLLRYCNINEERLFDKDHILKELDSKIGQLKQNEDDLQREADKLGHVLEMYESGKNIKLPDDFEKKLDEHDIPLLYGLAWLKRQTISIEQKLELIKRNPFLPYAIIMDSDRIRVLREERLDIFTSLPIPIVDKNRLGESLKVEVVNNMYSLENVSFYMAFNEKLLDEEELKLIINGLKRDIDKIISEKRIKAEEIRKYTVDRDNVVRFSVTKATLKSLRDEIDTFESECTSLEQRYEATVNEINGLEAKIKSYTATLEELKTAMDKITIQIDELESFAQDYSEYKNRKIKEKALLKVKSNLEKERKELINNEKQWTNSLDILKSELFTMSYEHSAYLKKLHAYKGYTEGSFIKKDIEELEAEFKASNEAFGLEVEEYNKFLANANIRFELIQKDLAKCQKQYDLIESEYKSCIYDTNKEELLEKSLSIILKDINDKHTYRRSIEIKAVRLETKAEGQLKDIERFCQQNCPVSVAEIVSLDFVGRKKVKDADRKACLEAMKVNETSMRQLAASTDKLEAFKGAVLIEDQQLEISYNEIEAFREKLVKEHRVSKGEENSKLLTLSDRCNELAVDFNYRTEAYFKNTIDTLMEVKQKPEDIKQILLTVKDIHQRTMLQLQSDLNRITEEQELIISSLLDYTREIYDHMSTIDDNSTIKIEEKPYKMLSISQPDWQNELYILKLRDFLDKIISDCKSYLDSGKSIDDTLEKEIATAKLYDYIVGINNVDIKLRKIETSKVVPISWNEVAQNSGGEGFVSAFIILVCMLSYMRREDDALVNTKEEGKVLIMDNPFAQTNAEHLLKPLMDIAKKYNTQLICFTGLGGDSIYNRFDNIYVLNLYDSKLHQGLQVMESEHKKGEDITQLSSSRFLMRNERYEQLSLF